MAISELKAVLSLEFGEFKASIATAKSSMDSFAQETQKAMGSADKATKNSQGIFSKAFNSMADAGDKFKAKQSSLVGTIAKTALGFAGIRSAADLFNSAIGRVDKINSAEKAIAQLTGSQKDAQTVMDGLQKVVEGTPLSLDSFTTSAKGMIAAGMEASKIEPVMTAIGDAAYGVGNGAESIDIMSAAFKSLQASGTASLGDLNRLLDQNIPVYQMIGNQLGMTVAETKKYISDGLLPSAKAIELVTKGIEEGTEGVNGKTAAMAGQMATAGDTIAGALGNVKTAIVKSLAKPIDNAYEKIVNGLKSVKDGIKAVQPQIEAAFMGIAEIVEGVILGMVDTFNMLKPVFDSVAGIVKKLAEHFKTADTDGKGLKEMAREMTPVIVALFAAFKGFVVLAKTASTLRTVKVALIGTQEAAGLLPKALSLAKAGFSGLSSAVSFLAANPIVLVIAAIAALVAGVIYLWKTNENFRNAVLGIWEAVKSGIKSAIDAVIGFFQKLWQSIVDVWNSIVAFMTPIVQTIAAVIQVGFMLVYEIIRGIMLTIKTVIQLIWESIKAYFTVVFGIIQSIFTVALGLLKTAVTTVFGVIKAFVMTVWDAIAGYLSEVWASIVAVAKAIWTPIAEFFSSIWQAISNFLVTVWTEISAAAAAIWNSLKQFFTALWNSIKTTAVSVWTVVKTKVTEIWNNIKQAATTVFNNVKSVVTAVWNTIKSVTTAVWNSIKAAITSVWNGIKSVTTSVVNGIKSVVTSVWNGIKSTTVSVWNSIKSAMTAPIEAAKNTISGIINKVKSLFNFTLKFPKVQIPHIPMPHFGISGSFSLKPPSVPRLSVNWYATGGIATGPSLVGIGEAGDEAILPLSNKGRMKPFAQAVSGYIDKDSKTDYSSLLGSKITLDMPIILDGRVLAHVMLDDLLELIERKQSRRFRKAGEI